MLRSYPNWSHWTCAPCLIVGCSRLPSGVYPLLTNANPRWRPNGGGQLNDTPDRNPFTDLYDTTNAHQSMSGFITRPVIGGIFAKALLNR